MDGVGSSYTCQAKTLKVFLEIIFTCCSSYSANICIAINIVIITAVIEVSGTLGREVQLRTLLPERKRDYCCFAWDIHRIFQSGCMRSC